MADEEKGATDTEQQQRDLAVALQLQLSLGEDEGQRKSRAGVTEILRRSGINLTNATEAQRANAEAEQAYMDANYGPLETANRMMTQTLDTLVLDYLPDKWKNKLADIGIGFPAGYEDT